MKNSGISQAYSLRYLRKFTCDTFPEDRSFREGA